MGCGSSNASNVVWDDEDEGSRYSGFGVDYVNYSYYQSHFTELSNQLAWEDYYKAHEYQKRLTELSSDNELQATETHNQYNQYKQWHEKRPEKYVKTRAGEPYVPLLDTNIEPVKKDTEKTVNLVIEHSSSDVRVDAKDEGDCVETEPVKLRFGLKTLSTALRITINKSSPPPVYGPDVLKVTVLDTTRRYSTSFLTEKLFVPKGESFVDEEFTSEQALGDLFRGKYGWKRPQHIYPDYNICLFHEGTSLDDIDQGCFGTCYFLATLAGMADQANIMKQIILPDSYNAEVGMFHCRFWRFGKWVDIYTDDCLPCDERGLVGCKSKNYAGEMWVPLIEKAYAKFMGSYPDVEGGTPRDAYLALTGGCAEWLALSYYKFNSADVYNRLDNALRHGSVVVCSSTPVEDELQVYIEEKGMIINHAYTVTATAIVERDEGIQESLVKLRNPWSHKEWTGAWGDSSQEWYTVDESQRLQLREIEDNGEFWMPWSEFWKLITDMTICSISPDYDSDGVTDGLHNVFCIYGQWTSDVSGGWSNQLNNPTYELSVPPNVEAPWYILVESIQKLPARVHKTTPGNILLRDLSYSRVEDQYLGADVLTYTTANPVTRRFEVKPGRRYHIIPTKYEAGEEGSFLLRVFSKDSLQIRSLRKKSRRTAERQ